MRRPLSPALAALLCLQAAAVFLALRPSVGDSARASRIHLAGARWWSQHKFPFDDPHADVRAIKDYFAAKQWRQFYSKKCGFNHLMVRAALQGLHRGLMECERQMTTEQWNCSRFNDHYKHSPNIFGKLLHRGVPQTAFVLAILSAGVTASIATECKKDVTCCPCRQHKNYDFGKTNIVFPGCDHNVKFAKRLARRLFDKAEGGRDIQYLSMLHNYNAGRKAVLNTLKSKCVCHGTSGSCTHRTCWREIGTMHEIGNKLKQEFQQAVKVERGSPVNIYVWPRSMRMRRRRRRKRLNLVVRDQRPDRGVLPAQTDLVYYETPPQNFFCRRRKEWGIMGPKGRICNVPGGNCDTICCNRPYKIEYYKHQNKKCNCKFVWCCDVKCQTCVTDKQRYICD